MLMSVTQHSNMNPPHCQGRQPMHSLNLQTDRLPDIIFLLLSIFVFYRILTRFKKIWRKRNLRFILHLLISGFFLNLFICKNMYFQQFKFISIYGWLHFIFSTCRCCFIKWQKPALNFSSNVFCTLSFFLNIGFLK